MNGASPRHGVDVLEVLSGLALLAMLLLTVADVLGRYVVGRPMPGAIELIQYSMAVVVFAALPVVTRKGQHVSVSLLDDALHGTLLRLQRIGVYLLCAGVLAALAWTLFDAAGRMREQGDVIGYLRLPLYPAGYLMAGLSAFTALVCLRKMVAAPGTAADPAVH